MQLVEIQITHFVDGLTRDRELQPGRPEPGAVAIRAGALHHHLIQPRFHPRAGFAPLPVAAVVALDTPRDSMEADLVAVEFVALHLGVRRQ